MAVNMRRFIGHTSRVNCVLCDEEGILPCPRCLKALCDHHGRPSPEDDYYPDKYCSVPIRLLGKSENQEAVTRF